MAGQMLPSLGTGALSPSAARPGAGGRVAMAGPRLGREPIRRQGVGVAQVASDAESRTRPRRGVVRAVASVTGAAFAMITCFRVSRLVRAGVRAVARLAGGGERWRPGSRPSGCGAFPAGARRPGRSACRAGPGPVPLDVARGLPGGPSVGHSSAMIASNSARSSSSSAYTSSRNSFSRLRVSPTGATGIVSIASPPTGQALMACRP
jgi:hypothetical protein